MIAVYGFIGLMISGHTDFKFIIAGFRTFMYFGVMNMIFMTYKELVYDYKWVKRLLGLTQVVIVMQTITVALQDVYKRQTFSAVSIPSPVAA